ncbi:eukaryotic cytochrome b561-domain-containing protein [Glomus cerebriforme]|uniref:Eukaryotic cytochrome b561-domain-containing protein n=1 Tax=Glomus cerebriforme TaxID=658196 RepID=A0A397TPZ3_9GLOM|nr:eukaryotic cytochrome b561-domain-containing protein [Glomus cerebriforme]
MSFVFSLLVSLGAFLFASTVWYITSSVDYFFFIWHPTLMAMVILMATQGIAILQKAETRQEKEGALNFHKLMQSITFLSVIGGFYITYTFKAENNAEHFTSPHGKFGLITFSFILIQSIAGSTLVNFPGVVGGAAKARAMYKYHRISGYFLLPLIWLTALGGTQADWTKSQFDHLWIWLTAAGMVLVGTVGNINSNKLKVR